MGAPMPLPPGPGLSFSPRKAFIEFQGGSALVKGVLPGLIVLKGRARILFSSKLELVEDLWSQGVGGGKSSRP